MPSHDNTCFVSFLQVISNDTGCYMRDFVGCKRQSDNGTQCTASLQFVWNGTPCGTDDVSL